MTGSTARWSDARVPFGQEIDFLIARQRVGALLLGVGD